MPESNPEPNNDTNEPIRNAWLGFAKSVRLLIVPQQDDRPLDQYLALRDSVFAIVQSPEFLKGLSLINIPADPNMDKIHQAFVLELESFPRAVEVAQTTTEKNESVSKNWSRKLLGIASTTVSSMPDVVNCSPFAKAGLKVFGELCDIFKGNT